MHTPDAQGYIPFIHNYCDRRCERCRFVRQCRVGAVDVDDVGEAEDAAADETPEDLRKRLMKLMGLSEEDMAALDAAKEERANEPVDPVEQAREEAEMAEWKREQEALDRKVDAHPLSVMGSTYLDLVRAWIEAREASLKARGVQLHHRMGVDIPAELHTPEMLVLSEAVQELLWFHTIIPAKVGRALHGRMGRAFDDDPLQSDWNGSAKVCLDAVDRSVAAWDTIVELLPEEADDALPMQELLHRIRKGLENEFPDAQRFIRPGFDAHLGG